MHIPDGFLSPPVWGSLDALSGSVVAFGLNRVGRRVEEKTIPLIGVLAAFVFAAQMINIPVVGGVSGHFLGGALAGILLGPWSGLVMMTGVLWVQCLLFQDGGLAALGANILNMGILGSLGAYWIATGLRRVMRGPQSLFWTGFWAAWLTTLLSALSCASILAWSGVVRWSLSLSLIGGVHVVFGFVEGLVTGTILAAIRRTRPDLLERPRV
jgi:cobalt/nickel transport system permease protein